MTQGPLAYVEELERRDEMLGAALATLGALRSRVHTVVTEAKRVRDELARLPHDREVTSEAIERHQVRLATARDELAQAEQAAAHARRDRVGRQLAAEAARRAVDRAQEELASAQRRAEGLVAAERAAQQEAAAVEAEAAAIAGELAAAPRLGHRVPAPPESGLDGVTAWAARADGALLLARSGLEDEREAVVREANELAFAVLGELPAPAGVRRIRERLQAAL